MPERDDPEVAEPADRSETPARPDGTYGLRALLTQYAAPTVVASLIATAVSVFTAFNAAQEQQRQYNTKFEELLTRPEIASAYGGSYVDLSAQNKDRARQQDRENFEQSVREQRAAAALLSLGAVADSETQRRTVLLIGARLLNADSNYTQTGAPAARVLTVLIDEADTGRFSLNPWERAKNAGLWRTINSQSFRDLVTAGYSSDYYNDDFTNRAMWPYSPTLNGDAPITTDARYQILHKLTRPQYDGWIHVATFGYRFPRSVAPHASAHASGGVPAVSPALAADFLDEMIDVTIRRDAANIEPILTQYAIPDPRRAQPVQMRFEPREVLASKELPLALVMLRNRLLRSRPPVQYINPDGKFRKGSLGAILGAVAAGACVTVVEPFVPVLVFVPTDVATGVPGPKGATSQRLSGLVHMWAHVRGSNGGEDCLTTVGKP